MGKSMKIIYKWPWISSIESILWFLWGWIWAKWAVDWYLARFRRFRPCSCSVTASRLKLGRTLINSSAQWRLPGYWWVEAVTCCVPGEPLSNQQVSNQSNAYVMKLYICSNVSYMHNHAWKPHVGHIQVFTIFTAWLGMFSDDRFIS